VAPTPQDVLDARERLDPYLEPTPLLESPGLGALLKLETVQPTGSFKVRGAFAALTCLAEGSEVVTASAGNHGLGVACAAETLELAATVVCARTASPLKLEKLRRYPVRLVLEGERFEDAEAYARELAAAGARYVSAYADSDVIAGQGTIAVELLEELPGPLTIVVPGGGGGLLAGVALWASTRPGVRVVGVQSEASPSLRASLDAGRVVEVPQRPTLADGLAGNLEPGALSLELLRELGTDVVAVSEDDVAEGMRFLHREHGIAAEGAGAIGAGALLAGRIERHGTVVCLVTGRNVDPDVLARVLAEA
jgi:threonine dehydratase